MGAEIEVTIRITTAQNGYVVHEVSENPLSGRQEMRAWICATLEELQTKVMGEALKAMLNKEDRPPGWEDTPTPSMIRHVNKTPMPWVNPTMLTGTAVVPNGTFGVVGTTTTTPVFQATPIYTGNMNIGETRNGYDNNGNFITLLRTA